MANGRIDFEEYLRGVIWDRVQDWFRHHFVEEVEESEETQEDAEGSEEEEDWVKRWETLVHNRRGCMCGRKEEYIDWLSGISDSSVGGGEADEN